MNMSFWRKKPELEVIVVSYHRVPQLRALIYSLLAQTSKDFAIHVIHDGRDEVTKSAITTICNENPDVSIRYSESTQRFNDYGHSLRSIGLQESTGRYTLLTNDDNYYVPTFIEEMLKAGKESRAEIVFCNMVHNHVFEDLPNPIGYQVLVTEPKLNRIDMGAFIFETKIGKKVGFNSRLFEADWDFFEGLIRSGASYKKIEKVLFVHN